MTIETTSAQLASTTTELEREATARERLEWTLRELERQIQVERHEFEHRSERQAAQGRQFFIEETQELLDSLQKELNSAFERKATSVIHTSGNAPTIRRTHTTTTVATSSQPSPLSSTEEAADEKKWDFGDFIPYTTASTTANTNLLQQQGSLRSRAWKLPSPLSTTHHDIDRALDETEAMVRSLLGDHAVSA
jgi:exonuclease VII large subunit